MLINKYGSSEQGSFGPMGNHEGSQKGELSGSLPRGEPVNRLHCETRWRRAENTEEIVISSGLKNISRAGLISSTTFIKCARPNAEGERSRRIFRRKRAPPPPTGSTRPSLLFRLCPPRYPLYYLFLRVLPLSETKPDRMIRWRVPERLPKGERIASRGLC
jgi:hypothetical protein